MCYKHLNEGYTRMFSMVKATKKKYKHQDTEIVSINLLMLLMNTHIHTHTNSTISSDYNILY